MALSNKQRRFIDEYLQCYNATRAALLAGYSERTAHAIGWENLRKPEIAEAVSQRLSESAMMADEVLMRLADQARGDLGEFLSNANGSIEVDLAGMKAAKKTHLIKKITQTKRRKVYRDTEDEEVVTSLELYDAQAAQVHLGRHHKLFTDRNEVEVDDNLDDATRTARIVALLEAARERRARSAAESGQDDLEAAAGATD